MKDDYLHIKAAADFLGVHPATLRRWDANGTLRAERDGLNNRVYRRSRLKAARERIH